MADKPSRALVLYGDGLARYIEPSHTHLHSLASKALCGFLSLPNAPPSESKEQRIVREFAELLDASENYFNAIGSDNNNVESQKSMTTTISERFMGMKAAVVTNDPGLPLFCGKLGLTVLQPHDLIKKNHGQAQLAVDILASELLELLGFKEGKTLETCQFDLVLVHIGAGERANSEEEKAVAEDMEYINTLNGVIINIVQNASEIASRLHLSLVMSYAPVSEEDTSNLSVFNVLNERNPNLAALFPRQSYTMRGEALRQNVRHHCPMLIAQWQHAVTRVDMAQTFSFKEFKEHGGNLVIPADRFLHEVAFKLWKAPKYGA